MYVCWDIHQDTYLDIWVRRVIIIKGANYGSVVCFAEFASIGFEFSILWLLYYTCSCPAFPLIFYSTSLLLLPYHTMSSSCLISLAIHLLSHVCLCSRHDFQCMFIIRIYRYKSVIYARHLALASPLAGEFWLPWILMSRSRSLELVDSPSCWPEMRSGSMDHWQTV